MPPEPDVYLLLGATGDLGAELLRQLAERDRCRIVCLVRASRTESPAARLAKVLATIGVPPSERIRAIEGDVTAPRLGLAPPDYDQLARTVTHVIHSAADSRFNLPLEDARRANLEGTRTVVEFAETARRLSPRFSVLAWLGTAYVAGRRSGLVREDELSDRYGFNNTYEQSKFEAEQLLRAASAQGLPTVIFRPSVIVGASANGQFDRTSVLYPLITLYSKLLPSLVLPRSDGIRIDLVPRDFVARSILYLMSSPANHGRTFHLASGAGRSVSIGAQFARIIAEGLELPGVRFVPSPLWMPIVLLSRFFRPRLYKGLLKLRKMNELGGYSGYVRHSNPEFDVSGAVRALEGSGIEVPDPVGFLRACVAYAKAHYVN